MKINNFLIIKNIFVELKLRNKNDSQLDFTIQSIGVTLIYLTIFTISSISLNSFSFGSAIISPKGI